MVAEPTTETAPKTEEAVMMEQLLAEEPGGFKPRAPIPGQEATPTVGGEPVPMATLEVTSAGYIVVYSTKTAEPSLLNRNMLPFINPTNTFVWRHEDGTLAFTTVKPKNIEVIRGTILCVLHPDYEQRGHYDRIGLKGKVCTKSNFRSVLDQRRHAERRHRDEWALIKEDKEEREKDEDRALQREMIRAAGTGRAPAVTPVADTTPVGDVAPVQEYPPSATQVVEVTVTCKTCGKFLAAKTKVGALSKRRAHMKKEHLDG